MSSQPTQTASVTGGTTGAGNPFADINAQKFIETVETKTAVPTTVQSSATPNATPTAAVPAPTPAPIVPRPYNPNAQLSQLDALALPDETENARLAKEVTSNVANLIAQKQMNEQKQQKVGSVLASKVKAMEEEQRKLQFIRSELSKLDQNLSRNIDVLRAEIEACGREVNTLQKDFEYKEKEYLECRKALAKTKQRKLLLTSHLDYIILTNENEKASKLTELELSLGLTPSSPLPIHDIPSPPHSSMDGGSPPGAYPHSPHPGQPPHHHTHPPPASHGHAVPVSNGPSPAVLAAAKESQARHAAAVAAAHIPKDHPGLSLSAVAPPAFGGFDVHEAEAQSNGNDAGGGGGGTNPFGPPTPVAASQSQPQPAAGPSPAALAAQARHVSVPPKQNAVQPKPAQSTLSIANKNKASPIGFTPDGQFAGFTD